MSIDQTREFAKPDPGTPKTFGILNVIFALVLLPCGVCAGFYQALPAILSLATEAEELRLEQQKTQRKEQIARYQEEEKAATDDAAREEIREKRELLERQPVIESDNPKIFSDPRLRDPRYVGHVVADLASGLLLNLAMLISGVGLIYLKGWARRLAVAVAWLKIARLLALALSASFVVAPFVSRVIASIEAEALAANPKAAPEESGPFIAMMLTAWVWALFAVGSIYPGLTIWLLGQPAAREACRSRPKTIDDGGW